MNCFGNPRPRREEIAGSALGEKLSTIWTAPPTLRPLLGAITPPPPSV